MHSFPNLEPICYSMSGSNCCFLTCTQISQESGKVVWNSHLFQNFPQFIVIHTVKDFCIVNKTEIDVFLKLLIFLRSNRSWQSDLWFLCLFSIQLENLEVHSSCTIEAWGILIIHVLLKPSLENFEHYFASVWDECNCAIVWTFFGITFLRDWN